jgi:hypothetical protein
MTRPASYRPAATPGMISWNGTTSMRPGGRSALHSRKSRYAVVRSPGTATVAPGSSPAPSRVRTSGPQPRPTAPPHGSNSYVPSSHGSAAKLTLTRS